MKSLILASAGALLTGVAAGASVAYWYTYQFARKYLSLKADRDRWKAVALRLQGDARSDRPHLRLVSDR